MRGKDRSNNRSDFLEYDHFRNRQDGQTSVRDQRWEPETCAQCGKLLDKHEAGFCDDCNEEEYGESDKKHGLE